MDTAKGAPHRALAKGAQGTGRAGGFKGQDNSRGQQRKEKSCCFPFSFIPCVNELHFFFLLQLTATRRELAETGAQPLHCQVPEQASRAVQCRHTKAQGRGCSHCSGQGHVERCGDGPRKPVGAQDQSLHVGERAELRGDGPCQVVLRQIPAGTRGERGGNGARGGGGKGAKGGKGERGKRAKGARGMLRCLPTPTGLARARPAQPQTTECSWQEHVRDVFQGSQVDHGGVLHRDGPRQYSTIAQYYSSDGDYRCLTRIPG